MKVVSSFSLKDVLEQWRSRVITWRWFARQVSSHTGIRSWFSFLRKGNSARFRQSQVEAFLPLSVRVDSTSKVDLSHFRFCNMMRHVGLPGRAYAARVVLSCHNTTRKGNFARFRTLSCRSMLCKCVLPILRSLYFSQCQGVGTNLSYAS
jgi:hypothetical protein